MGQESGRKGIHSVVNRSEFINSLRSLLSYHESCGINGYGIDEDTRSRLKELGHLAPDTTVADDRGKEVLEQQVKTVDDQGACAQPTGIQNIIDVKTEINRCINCSLHTTRQISTAGSDGVGGRPLKLLIVGDWLTVSSQVPVKDGELFGTKQDLMLARMIEAIDLTPGDVFITNVIKCSIPESCQPTSEHINSCSNYLKMQIEILSPQIICSMGIIASRLLTKQSKPLSQQRGHFFSCKTGSGQEIPVMPTYHPTFLLQNPEMKQATWADLQAIRQRLNN